MCVCVCREVGWVGGCVCVSSFFDVDYTVLFREIWRDCQLRNHLSRKLLRNP